MQYHNKGVYNLWNTNY